MLFVWPDSDIVAGVEHTGSVAAYVVSQLSRLGMVFSLKYVSWLFL